MALMLTAAVVLLAISKPTDSLVDLFQNPPLRCRPHTWWHWMNGNVTKEGITADLEAMKAVGIGGAQMFTVDQGIPAGPASYGGSLWRELTTFAIKEASRLGIEICLHNCAGWSSSGGPWIKPEDAMQVLAWSTKVVKGGHVDVALDPIKAPQVLSHVDYSQDIAVYAIPGNLTYETRDLLGRTGVTRQDGVQLALSEKAGTQHAQILDITSMFKDGKVQGTLPEGTWTILRLGHVPTGKDNHPAPPEGDGLEVDKLSKEAFKHHWEGLPGKVISDASTLKGSYFNNLLIDSYEVYSQNWTPKMREEFKRLRGYDPQPYLPALTGIVVDNANVTERFLWDYRRTIADLYAENYFGYAATLSHENKLMFSTEPYGNGGFDNIQAGGTADIPMGEFWIGGAAMESTKLASSIGHIYGRPVIGAESFTADDVRGRYLEEPYMMKTVGDLAFVNGINRYIFHRYAMQPWTKYQPGMTMGPWGTHLERTQTWWNEAKTWLQYVARCQALLQSGRFVADAVVFQGESAPVDLPYGRGSGRVVPEGYDYDGCDTKTLMAMKVDKGEIVLSSGMRYKLLVLLNSQTMTLPVAKKILSLMNLGIQVVGQTPEHSPTLVGYPKSEQTLKTIFSAPLPNRIRNESAGDALRRLNIPKDFSFKGSGARLLHIHRQIGDADVYFVSNQRYQSTLADCTFRISGKQPELFFPETGVVENASVWKAMKGSTRVSLKLKPAESVFVVFRNKPTEPHLTSISYGEKPVHVPKVMIIQAKYGSADGRGVDVTKKVRELVAQGDTEIEATNANFGDPVFNVLKSLTIEYSVDGQVKKDLIAENSSLVLPSAQGGPVPDFELSTKSGVSTLTAWEHMKGTLEASNGKGATAFAVNLSSYQKPIDLSEDWGLTFAPKLGAPASAKFAKLESWSLNSDPGIKYFSGSATYTKQFECPYVVTSEMKVRLNLGEVKNFATVTLNGKLLGTFWRPPYIVDVTKYIRLGKNVLSVQVTNLWVNRLIGDAQLPEEAEWDGNHLKKWPEWLLKNEPRPATGRVAFTTWKFWDKNSPLLDSGLIGPVKIEFASQQKIGLRK